MIRIKMKDGMDRWTAGLAGLFRRKGKEARDPLAVKGPREARAAPRGEGERALHQAMGWGEEGES